MKIKIEIDDGLSEQEIVLRCPALDEDVISIQRKIQEAVNSRMQLNVTQGDTEYYLTLEEILFFETASPAVAVHTTKQIFETKMKLYELEELLPGVFMRVSKSTIINTAQIRAIHKNITGASEVEFANTQKKVFVSRNYFKPLMSKLEEKRLKS